MSFDSTKQHLSHFAGLGDSGRQHAIILRRTFADGKIKVFEDERGLTEKTEVLTKDGSVVIYKEFNSTKTTSKFTKIEIYSLTNEFRDSLDIFIDNQIMLNPTYRFFYHRSQIGVGKGDIAMAIAQKLLATEADAIDPRYFTGAAVDQEVVDTLLKILQGKIV